MSSKKKNSIDWLMDELTVGVNFENDNDEVVEQRWNRYIDSVDLLDYFKKAKELHRQEIIYAYEVGFSDGWNDVKYDKPKYSDAEQYYKDNYE